MAVPGGTECFPDSVSSIVAAKLHGSPEPVLACEREERDDFAPEDMNCFVWQLLIGN